jgi:hypothetical protein
MKNMSALRERMEKYPMSAPTPEKPYFLGILPDPLAQHLIFASKKPQTAMGFP